MTKTGLAAGIPGFPGPGAGLGVYEAGTPGGVPDAVRETGPASLTVAATSPSEAFANGTWRAYSVDNVTHHTDVGVPYDMVLQLADTMWAGEFTTDVAARLAWLLRHADAFIAAEADASRAAAAVQVAVWQTLRDGPTLTPRADLVLPTDDPVVNALAAKLMAQVEASYRDIDPLAAPPALTLSTGPAGSCAPTLTLATAPGAAVSLSVDGAATLGAARIVAGADGTARTTLSLSPGATATVSGAVTTGGTLVRADIPGPALLDSHITPTHESEAPEEFVFLGGAATATSSVQASCPGPPPPPPGTLRVTKRGPAVAVSGQAVTYRIQVRNTGAGPLSAVSVRDTLPRGLSLVRRPIGAKIVKGSVVWSIGALAPGQRRTLLVTARIDRGLRGKRCNTVIASAASAASVRARSCTAVRAIAGVVRIPAVTG